MNSDRLDNDEFGSGEAAGQTAVPKPAWEYTYTTAVLSLHQRSPRASSTELNEAAGLDWSVYQTPACFFVPEKRGAQPLYASNGIACDPLPPGHFKLVGVRHTKGLVPLPAYYLNVRDDLQQVVGVVKKRYRILQNEEAPTFLDQIVQSGEAAFETAGALHGGSHVFWLMKLAESITVAADLRETLQTYLLLTNSHDGSTSVIVSAMSTRTASQNTLVWSLPSVPRTMKVRHTDSAKEQTIEARRALEIGRSYQATLAELAARMAQTPISDELLHYFLEKVIPTPRPVITDNRVANRRGITMADNTKGVITQIYHHNENHASIRGTLWGAVQACEFYANHLSINRNTDDASADENRFKRISAGTPLGGRAFAAALRLL